jgi:hypothetical protein
MGPLRDLGGKRDSGEMMLNKRTAPVQAGLSVAARGVPATRSLRCLDLSRVVKLTVLLTPPIRRCQRQAN